MKRRLQAAVLSVLGSAILAGCVTRGGLAPPFRLPFHAVSEAPPQAIVRCVTEKWRQRIPSVVVSPLGQSYVLRATVEDSIGATVNIEPYGRGSSVRYTDDVAPPLSRRLLDDLKLCL